MNSLNIKDWTGRQIEKFSSGDNWCIDREKNAFLMYMGGGRADEPYIWTFWWDGHEVRIEVSSGYAKPIDGKPVQEITEIIIPIKAFERKDEILKLIYKAFSSNDRLVTKILCEPKEGDE